MAERTFFMNLATTYPAQHAALEREMDKILSDARRQRNVKRVKTYLMLIRLTPPHTTGGR